MFLAPILLLSFVMVVGVLVFLMIYSVRRGRQRGAAHMMTAIGIWAGIVVLVALAAVVSTVVPGRSHVSASAEELTGYWTSESSEGTAAIELRSDGSAFLEGVPSAAVFEVGFGDDLGLPPMLSGEGSWEVEPWQISVELTCANGQTVTLLSEAVKSYTGAMYLQFMSGDPDAWSFFREFSRVESGTVPDFQPEPGLAC